MSRARSNRALRSARLGAASGGAQRRTSVWAEGTFGTARTASALTGRTHSGTGLPTGPWHAHHHVAPTTALTPAALSTA